MLTCPRCGEASISALRVLKPSFGSVVTCPACETPLRNTSRRSTNHSLAIVLSFIFLQGFIDKWPVVTVALLTALALLACYVYVRFARLEPIAVELDPNKWTARRASRRSGGR
jgi:uncharacterized paraquat-inducible protein A